MRDLALVVTVVGMCFLNGCASEPTSPEAEAAQKEIGVDYRTYFDCVTTAADNKYQEKANLLQIAEQAQTECDGRFQKYRQTLQKWARTAPGSASEADKSAAEAAEQSRAHLSRMITTGLVRARLKGE
jgi:acyl-CoA reductase-like NAD-dependent aldehyde dehydrogenase